jgi:hypothetical protein
MRLLLTSLLAAGVLAGCGGEDGNKDAVPSDVPASERERDGGGTKAAPDAPEDPGG